MYINEMIAEMLDKFALVLFYKNKTSGMPANLY